MPGERDVPSVPRYESVRAESRRFGRNHFLEVSRKKLVEEGRATEFVLVARGYVDKDGTRRWSRFITVPDEDEMKEWLAQAILQV